MGVSVGVLDHFNIRTRNLADTVRFYEDVLGLEKGARPNFAFPGAWMYSEGKAVVHLVDISKTDEAQKPDSGVVHHVAFASSGFDGMKRRLDLALALVHEPEVVQEARARLREPGDLVGLDLVGPPSDPGEE